MENSNLINGKYKMDKKLGSGSFGEIYLGIDITSKEQVAIKFEKKELKCPQLEYEFKLLKYLQNNSQGITDVIWFGKSSTHNIMVMECLGLSLEDLFQKCSCQFSMKTVLMLADLMLQRIQYVHSKNFIHRDIKPDNFMMGNQKGKNKDNLYIIDFGLAKKYKHFSTGLHITYKDGRSLVGTARYASINNHNGIEQSRRDDLESIGYVLIYFLKGNLPWQGLKCNQNEDKYEKIKQKKVATTIAVLTKGFPEEFALYLKYVKELQFEETPNYDQLRKLFKDLFNKLGEVFDYNFDWKQISNVINPNNNNNVNGFIKK